MHKLEALEDAKKSQFHNVENKRWVELKEKLKSNILTQQLQRVFEVEEKNQFMDSDETVEEESIDPEILERERQELKRLKKRYCKTSLNQLGYDSSLRRYCIYMIEDKLFDTVIISLIAFNSVLLGLNDYSYSTTTKKTDLPLMNRIVDTSELFFAIAFTLEACIKIIALGFIFGNQNCYLRDPWNWLDFTVVVTGVLNVLPNMQNMSILRTFRLFRPLRTLSTVPSMKLLVATLFNSVS